MTLVKLNKDSPVAINSQIMRQIIFAVMRGELCPGDQVQSVRSLGPEIDADINTVNKAYQCVKNEGIIYSRQGVGYFVEQNAFAEAERWTKKYFEDKIGLVYREAFAAGWSSGDLTTIMINEFKDKKIY